ncbi:MAG: nucleotidyltransferase family protein [Proteobacteria bacterium]|nr:nucleotidyltransferase family protein [Pseudomonadota bacterium]
MARARIHIASERLAEFCRRWKIAELALFGSALRSDFKPDSDVDMLVTFEAGAAWSLMDHVRIQDELADLLGRKVDLVSRKGIERSRNYIRRKAILGSAEVIYAAA